MPVYLLTIHTYGSWMPDNPRGYVQDQTIQPTNIPLADAQRATMKASAVMLSDDEQRQSIRIALSLCERVSWHLYAAAAEPTHLHLLAGWRTTEPWNGVLAEMKNNLARRMNAEIRRPKPRWFSHGGSRKRIVDKKHFDDLIATYLPKHAYYWHESHEQ